MESPSVAERVARSSEKLAYTIRAAAVLVDLSERSLWRFIREGRLAVYKVSPGRILIPRDALVGLLESTLDKSGTPLRAAPAHLRTKTAAAAQPAATAAGTI